MKYYNFEGQINKENVNLFLEFINNLGETKHLTFFLNSSGGSVCSGETLYNTLNHLLLGGIEVLMLINGECSSTAIEVARNFTGEKRIISDIIHSILHLTTYSLNVRDLLKKNKNEVIYKAISDDVDAKFIKEMSVYLNEWEIDLLKTGDDVQLSKEQLEKIINNKYNILRGYYYA